MLLNYFLLGASDLDEILYILSEDGRVDAENYQFSRVRALFASRACRTAVMIGKLTLNSSEILNLWYRNASKLPYSISLLYKKNPN